MLRALALLLSLAALPALAVQAGDAAPEIVGQGLDGARVQLSALRGKVVYVDFWAAWCAPCRVALPLLATLNDELARRGFTVLGVNRDDDPEMARRLSTEAHVHYPVIVGADEHLYENYQLPGMPAGYLVDRRGKVRTVSQGFRPSELPSLRNQIEKLLEEK